ncbi:hypothetical protein GCM10010172_82470 [Paractinoplanes ferrugineus]|uniref:Uncharacterized protein n=1 Tax=Paractinoplanes ferrugineus TaxID=113564 RepID=A0A919IYI8_9ACTN|nr:hypothetical protein [Actinoplanes ferrugineus]GIE10568.1 hypothetical protein Afe05nite_24080 [Actinoplanes ferrugineus]
MAPPDEGSPTARLTALAVHLRDAATEAGRPDVAEKAAEAVALLAGAAPAGDGSPQSRRGPADAILRTLDGLGF